VTSIARIFLDNNANAAPISRLKPFMNLLRGMTTRALGSWAVRNVIER
jgi:hypothetical protein